MLCLSCRRRLDPGQALCPSCGAVQTGSGAGPLELVGGDGVRVALTGDMTIGRAPGSTLRLDHPTISRSHARILAGNGSAPQLEDAGSSHGTFLDGRRLSAPQALQAGGCIRLGDIELRVERGAGPAADPDAAMGTIVIRAGDSLVVRPGGAPELLAPAAEATGGRPRLREGVRLKRGAAEEGPRRWLVQDPASHAYLRVDDEEGGLLALLDGEWGLAELVAEARRRLGPTGVPRLVRLLADLGERGLLEAATAAEAAEAPRARGLRRLLTQRERSFDAIGDGFVAAYRHGGWLLFTRAARVPIALLVIGGLIAAGVLVAKRYGTPFVVASHLGLGGLVFLFGRAAVVVVHEAAHGLALASVGRRATRAGVRLLGVFPYVFVDLSEAWFERRRRRIEVSVAGPVADLCCGGGFALACLVLPEGTVRDICFQVAFAAYVGALFNLNPFLDRDGYQILVDVLREPGLRPRAKAQLARRLSGGAEASDSSVLTRYAVAGVGWTVLAAAIAAGMTLRYRAVMEHFASSTVVWVVLVTVWLVLLTPAVLTVGGPLLKRWRSA